MSRAVSVSDVAEQLLEMAADVQLHGWAEYSREHVVAILAEAAQALQLGDPIIGPAARDLHADPGRHVAHPSQRHHLSVVEP